MIGVLGFDCGRFTYREIMEMWIGKVTNEWFQTAGIIAMTHNVQCTKKSSLKDPAEFNPYSFGSAKGDGISITPDDGGVVSLALLMGAK